jgi:transcriptional regulator with XRE-family HTH domain
MSTPIGKKIRNIREHLELGRAEFSEKTGIPKQTLIGLEKSERGVHSDVLTGIARLWPEYAAYLLTDIIVKQEHPKIQDVILGEI